MIDRRLNAVILTRPNDLASSRVADIRLRGKIFGENIKRRLRWLVQMTDDGSKVGMARKLEKAGYPVDETTVGRWVDDGSPNFPDALYLSAILAFHPEISADYILGRRPPANDEERVIEKKIGGKA